MCGQWAVLVAVRSAGAPHRLLDVLPVFDGDARVAVRFALPSGSEFTLDVLAALYAAALGRSVVGAYDGGRELTPFRPTTSGPACPVHSSTTRGILSCSAGRFSKCARADGSGKGVRDEGATP
ncbi:hypothetical protein ACFYNX_31905 [Streptomyces sp. NPDC007872]|uniref:hypothetical protein n=1 Tax=Streptomyces sp. NPDC007872 TaxID=3364782 RepID=UPI0036B379E8